MDVDPLDTQPAYLPEQPIVCLTLVSQSLLPLFCDKTFEFAIQTWQTSLEHYYVYVQIYFLSQLRKMLILLISSYCKMCTLPTLQYNLTCLSVANNTNTRDRIVGNGQILQWDLMSKINI